jgi:hypothetical protein
MSKFIGAEYGGQGAQVNAECGISTVRQAFCIAQAERNSFCFLIARAEAM